MGFVFSALGVVAGVAALCLVFFLFCLGSLLMAPMAIMDLSLWWPLSLTAIVAGLFLVDSFYSRRDDFSIVPLWLLRETVGLGPRLFVESYRAAVRSTRLARLDAPNCAAVLTYLAVQYKSVSREELLRTFPDLAWSQLKPGLSLIEGVLFLRSDASRITLTEPLRLTLRRILGPQARFEPQPGPEPKAAPEPPPRVEPEDLSPEEILGVSSSATLAEIKLAYRTRVKECHPDRFAGLDPASRALAEEWTKSLNAAYATLMAQAANKRVAR